MLSSPRMGWPYPSENAGQWFDTFRSFVEAADASGFASREDRNLILSGGGTIGWSAPTLSWSVRIVIVSPISGFQLRVEPGSVSLTDGQVLYVDLTRAPTTNVVVVPVVSSKVPSSNSALILAVRLGNFIYWRNGLMMDDGDSFTNIGASQGSGSALEIEDEGVSVDAATVNLDFVGAGVIATQTVPGHVQVSVPGGGGGAASYPDINQWITVDKTSGSYVADGTIQFPFNSVASAIVAAVALSPTPSNPVGIKVMPGVYVESDLSLPSYVHIVGEDRDACVLLSSTDDSVIKQVSSHASWRDLTIQRTGVAGTITGTGDDITADSPVWGTATLDDAAGAFTPGMVGHIIQISGAANWQNDGAKVITAVNSPTQIEIDNSWAVTVVGDSFTYEISEYSRMVEVGSDDWAGTVSYVSDVLFEDVVFRPGERYGVIVHGACFGTGDDITANTPDFGVATLDDAGGSFSSSMVGKRITITGAAYSSHNGSFVIVAVNSATQIVVGMDTWDSVVGDSFTYAIESDVDFKGCRAYVDYPASDFEYFGSFLSMYSSVDVGPRVRLRECEIFGDIHAMTGVLEMRLCDVDDGQVRLTSEANGVGSASIYISRSRLSLTSFKQAGHFGRDWGALHLHTTGEVMAELSSFVALGVYDGCGSSDSYGVYVASTAPAELSSSIGFMNCHLGYDRRAFASVEGDYSIPAFSMTTDSSSMTEYVSARFFSCAFSLPVNNVHNIGATIFPVGIGQMYNSVSDVINLIKKIGTDYLTIKLFGDKDIGVAYWLPSGQWVVFDLNGFTGSGTIIDAGSFANDQYVVVKNGKLDGSTLANVTAGASRDVQGIFEDLEIINGANVQAIDGAVGSKLIFRNIRGWVGKNSSWGMRLSSTTFEYLLERVYIKGGGTTEAIQFDNVATALFTASRCTFIHGSGGANLPLKSAASVSQGSATVTLDFCRMNADPTSDAFISSTTESAYNIYDNNLVDYLG